MKLKNGVRIRLVRGATIYAQWEECDSEAHHVKPDGKMWVGELWLLGGRIACIQAYNGKRRMNRAWIRKRAAGLLDKIAPGWTVIEEVVK